jgi:threonine dehydrogenase-like Zn-dependent dehydrogenase
MRERGIFGLHGYWSELAVDEEVDLVLVPASLADRAVLMEPLSVVEKAVEAALRVHEPGAASALVFGAGPIGTLAAFVLRLRGLSVSVHSLEAPSHPRAALLASAGIEYLAALGDASADIVIEAAGSPTACVQAVNCLAPLGVCVILGAPDSTGDFPFRSLITGNRTVLGSVNASPHSFALAARDLELFPREIIAGMIDRFDFARFDQTILAPQASRPKLVHVISD